MTAILAELRPVRQQDKNQLAALAGNTGEVGVHRFDLFSSEIFQMTELIE